MIRCQGVYKTYRTGGSAVQALRGVDLDIDEPGFYAIMGRSGSGKTTLLHLLAALDRPDSGSIQLNGRAVETLNDRQATLFRRKQLGIVFQQFNLISTLTAKENVELPGLLAGEDEKWLADRAMSLLEELGVADRAKHRPDALSGGEQQRVAIARAILFSPPIVLADEPTGALDSASADLLWKLLADLAAEKEITVLMVTHEAAAATHCRRVFAMNDGRVVGSFESEGADAGDIAARYQQLVG